LPSWRTSTSPASRRMARWCETVGWVTFSRSTISVTESQLQQQNFMIFCRVSSARALAKRTGSNCVILITIYLILYRYSSICQGKNRRENESGLPPPAPPVYSHLPRQRPKICFQVEPLPREQRLHPEHPGHGAHDQHGSGSKNTMPSGRTRHYRACRPISTQQNTPDFSTFKWYYCFLHKTVNIYRSKYRDFPQLGFPSLCSTL